MWRLFEKRFWIDQFVDISRISPVNSHFNSLLLTWVFARPRPIFKNILKLIFRTCISRLHITGSLLGRSLFIIINQMFRRSSVKQGIFAIQRTSRHIFFLHGCLGFLIINLVLFGTYNLVFHLQFLEITLFCFGHQCNFGGCRSVKIFASLEILLCSFKGSCFAQANNIANILGQMNLTNAWSNRSWLLYSLISTLIICCLVLNDRNVAFFSLLFNSSQRFFKQVCFILINFA